MDNATKLTMCEKALRVWDDMAEQGVPPELEPMSKLMLSCLARGRFDDGFRIFLAARSAENTWRGSKVLHKQGYYNNHSIEFSKF